VDEPWSALSHEDAHHVETHRVEGRLLLGQEAFGEAPYYRLLARGDGVERVSIARSAAQLHLDENEDVCVAQDQVQLPEARTVVALDELVASLRQVTQREVFAPGAGGLSAQGSTPA
jgi:hypothetical protein